MKISTLRKRFGDILVDVGIISNSQLKEALETQKITGEKLGTILAQMGVINEEVMLAFLGKQCGVSYVSLNEYGEIPPEVIQSVPESVARYQTLIPISKDPKTITIAMADPFNIFAIDDIKVMTGQDVNVVIASESEIKNAIDKYYSPASKLQSNLVSEILDTKTEVSDDEIINTLISDAVKNKSSDIHIEPQIHSLRIRHRIDGILRENPQLSKKYYEPILNKLKSMAGLNTAEHYMPQEGRIKVKIDEQNIDLRISVIPTITGERIALQILTHKLLCKDLSKLGFETETLAIYKKNIESSSGLIILTGPIYSGKTTTLYSTLAYLNHPDRNILTIENSVEYIIPGITHIQTRNAIGFTQNLTLQSIQKQNPDIIMIDEIHGQETANLTMNTALTGHLVFASLPISTTTNAIIHLNNMGIEPFMTSSALVMVVAQRLMRIICPHCKESYEIPKKNLKSIGIEAKSPKNKETVQLWRGKGCKNCNQTGYHGRTAIFEVLELDDKLRSLILERAPEIVLKQAAIKKGFITLREAAWRKVQSGISTAEEMLRITKFSE
ncbi:MAG: Flp pilus assembly complex ATPase component TadA [Endomicrobiales bacterium]|nr:Flp pilus assembly complex ATPase component TadA [Endomicrobiales bacterium]